MPIRGPDAICEDAAPFATLEARSLILSAYLKRILSWPPNALTAFVAHRNAPFINSARNVVFWFWNFRRLHHSLKTATTEPYWSGRTSSGHQSTVRCPLQVEGRLPLTARSGRRNHTRNVRSSVALGRSRARSTRCRSLPIS